MTTTTEPAAREDEIAERFARDTQHHKLNAPARPSQGRAPTRQGGPDMTRRLTPAERLAATAKDARLDDIVARSEWDQHVVEQAVLVHGLATPEWSCNDLRDLLPEMGHGYLGAAINSLRTAGIITHTGRMVPSTSPDTHGHRIAVWRITSKGHRIAAARQTASQGRAA